MESFIIAEKARARGEEVRSCRQDVLGQPDGAPSHSLSLTHTHTCDLPRQPPAAALVSGGGEGGGGGVTLRGGSREPAELPAPLQPLAASSLRSHTLGAASTLRPPEHATREEHWEEKSSGEHAGGGGSRSEGGALETLFSKHGLGDIYQRATQELGLEVLNLLALLVQKYKY